MDNYHPMYETVSYHASTRQPQFSPDTTKKDERYATLLPETKLKENESTQYQQPVHNHSSISRPNRKQRMKLKIFITTCITSLAVMLILLLVTVVLLSMVWITPTKSDSPHQTQKENCEVSTVHCILDNSKPTCKTDQVKLHATVSELSIRHTTL